MLRFVSIFVFPLLIAVVPAGLVSSSRQCMAAETAEATSVDVMGEAEMEVPGEFKKVDPKSRIIEHEFEASADDKTARVTMMAAGGDVAANISRWKGQFSGGDKEKIKSEEMKVGDWTVHMVDVNGTYAESMGGGPFFGGKKVQRPDYAMLGAILVHPEGRKYFVKMVGPGSVVEGNRERFVEMIRSIED